MISDKMKDLATKICGIKLKNPLVLASGIMGVTASSLINMVSNGAGAVTMKSLGVEERKGHHCPILASWEAGFINAVGLSNPGIENGIEEIKEYKRRCDAPIIASIFAFKTEDFGILAEKVANANPDFLEINISCPNVEDEAGRPFAYSPEMAGKITKIVKNKTGIPVIVKLNGTGILILKEIAKSVEKAGADAINMGNTLGPGLLINIEAAKPILSNRFGGMSGPAIKPFTLKCIWDIYETVKIPIIGTGGVVAGRDAVEMLMAGASAVGIGTGVYYRGLDVFRKVNDEISEFMEKNNYSSIKEMVGKAHV